MGGLSFSLVVVGVSSWICRLQPDFKDVYLIDGRWKNFETWLDNTHVLEGHVLREWARTMATAFWICSLVGKRVVVLLLFTLGQWDCDWPCQRTYEPVTSNRRCREMDNVCWTSGFCGKTIQIGCFNQKKGRPYALHYVPWPSPLESDVDFSLS